MTTLAPFPESLAERFERGTPKQRATALRALTLDQQHQLALGLMPWWFYGRSDQMPPPGWWRFWVIIAGRGWGKTRTGAEWAIAKMRRYPHCRVALVAPTFTDGRDTMVEGDSGILSSLALSDLRGGTIDDTWNRSMGELFLANGSQAKVFTSEKPMRLRGPAHHFVWGDEPSYWQDVERGTAKDSTFSNMNIGLRMKPRGSWPKDYRPQCVLTMTPRLVPLLKVPDDTLREHPERAGLLQRADSAITSGATWANLRNLSSAYYEAVIAPMIGTTLGMQELGGVLLEDVEGALWSREMINADRVETLPPLDQIVGTVVAFDPAGGKGATRDEHGIVVVSATGYQNDRHWYVRADRSLGGTPDDAARTVIHTWLLFAADAIVFEKNQGQDWIPTVIESTFATMIRDGEIPSDTPRPILEPVSAVKSKLQRATPTRGLYQQHRVHHVGRLPVLESQQTTWIPSDSDSPDRLDALVWGITWLDVAGPSRASIASPAARERRGRRPDMPSSRLPSVVGTRARRT